MINLHERMLPTSAGVEPATSWSPVGRRIQLSHRGQLHENDPISSELVDGSQLLHSWNIHSSSRCQCIPFYGCQPLWMGCSSRTSETIRSWSLDRRPISALHQYSRNNGHLFCIEKGHAVHTLLLCHDIHWQHNSSLIYQQTRRKHFLAKECTQYWLTT